MRESLRRDVAYALRLFRRDSLFPAMVVASLAIGLGANTTIFAVANALILHSPKGIADASSLVDIGRTRNSRGFDDHSYLEYLDLVDGARVFSGVYAYKMEPDVMSLGGRDGAESIHGSLVSANYFVTLGVQPHLGRLFDRRDGERLGASPVVVLNHRFWTRRFGRTASIVGESVTINGHPFTVAGVAPPGFQGTTILSPDVWVPIGMVAQATPARADFLNLPRGSSWISVGGRLRPGITLQQAQADLDRLAAGVGSAVPSSERYGLRVAPLAPIPGQATLAAGFIGLLIVITGMVLGVVCANVAGVIWARVSDRRGELALRLALGAERRRLIGQLLVEAILLFAAGGAVGILVGRMMVAGLLSLVPSLPVPVYLAPEFDLRVIAFATLLSLATAVLSAIVPALRATRIDLAGGLKSETAAEPDRQRLRATFVAVQVALSVVLVVGASLFARALDAADKLELGFEPDGLQLATVDFSLAGYTATTGPVTIRQLIERVRAIPSVESASLVRMLPLGQNVMSLGGLALPGDPPRSVQPQWNVVEPGYFRTLKIPLVRGRDFDDRDMTGNAPVAIINETAARQWWPGADPIGQTMGAIRDEARVLLTVVGVARDSTGERLGAAIAPLVFVPLQQSYQTSMTIVARSRRGQPLTTELRAAIASLDRNLPVVRLLTFHEHAALGLAPQRIAGWVAGVLGLFALALAAMGVYGMVAYLVTSRRRDIGIRVALGATPSAIATTVLRGGMRPVVIGLVLGLATAASAGRVLSSMLFGIPAVDLISLGLVALGFTAMAIAACSLPLRQALQIDPVRSLRDV